MCQKKKKEKSFEKIFLYIENVVKKYPSSSTLKIITNEQNTLKSFPSKAESD